MIHLSSLIICSTSYRQFSKSFFFFNFSSRPINWNLFTQYQFRHVFEFFIIHRARAQSTNVISGLQILKVFGVNLSETEFFFFLQFLRFNRRSRDILFVIKFKSSPNTSLPMNFVTDEIRYCQMRSQESTSLLSIYLFLFAAYPNNKYLAPLRWCFYYCEI